MTYALALTVGLVCLVQVLSSGRRAWFAGLAVACVLLAWVRPQHAAGLALATVMAMLYRGGVCLKPAWRWRYWLPQTFALILLGSGLLAAWLVAEPSARRAQMHLQAAAFVLRQFPGIFGVLGDSPRLSDLQPGYSALGLLALAVVAACFKPAWELRLLVGTALLLLVMLIPVPGLNPLLYSLVPDPVYMFCTGALWLRFMPLLVSLAIFSGALALSHLLEGRLRYLRVGVTHGLVLGALVWNFIEVRKPMGQGVRGTNTVQSTEAFYRLETAPLYYAYDSLPRPGYVVNGIVDYRLESRLLDLATKEVRPDPLLTGAGERVETLTTQPNSAAPTMFRLKPDFELPPGDRLLLRFEFFDKPYDGYLDISGPEFRSIYYLPNGGFLGKSFGVEISRPKVLSVWNTGRTSLPLQWSYAASVAPVVGKPFGDFARVHFQRYRPEDLQIKPRGLIPYRAEVNLDKAAYLEIPRVFIPGYRATVNGRQVPVEVSAEHLVTVRLEPGRNDVVVAYRGTVRLWIGFTISAATFLAGLVYAGGQVVCCIARGRVAALSA